MVHILFASTDLLRFRQITPEQSLQAHPGARHRFLCHFQHKVVALAQRNRGSGKQTFIQFHCFGSVFSIRYQQIRDFFQQAGHWEQQCCTENIKHRVAHSNTQISCGRTQQPGLEQCRYQREYGQPNDSTDNVKGKMNVGSALRIFVRAKGRKQCCHASADVLTHNNRDGSGIAHRSRGRQGLQNTHGGRAGLDDARQHSAHQHTQHRVFKHQKQILEFGNIRKTGHRTGHGVHAEHQRGEAQQDGTYILLLGMLGKHQEHGSDKCQHRGKGSGFEQLHKQIIAGNTTQGKNPCGDGGADIGTHNHTDGLLQGHKPGVHEAHHHDSGCGGTLNHSRNTQTGEKAFDLAVRQLAEKGFQTVACPALQTVAHDVHTKQKQAKAADHVKDIKNCHLYRHFCLFVYRSVSFVRRVTTPMITPVTIKIPR